jgi:xanthine dehydrogenase YagR molybdenum-binding subunit
VKEWVLRQRISKNCSTAVIAWAAALGAVNKVIKIAVADNSSPLYGHKADEILTRNGRIFLSNSPDKGETLTDVLTSNNMQKVEADAKTDVSTRPSQPQSALAGSQEAKIEEESKTNIAVQEDQNTDRKPYAFHSFGAQFAKVLVDPDLGNQSRKDRRRDGH